MKVVWLTKSSFKYKMELLNRIGEKVSLTVLFLEDKTEYRASDFYSDLNGNYTLVELKNLKDADKYIQEADIFVDSYYASKWGFHCTSVARKYKKHSIIQADGGIAIKRFFLIEKAISYFMNRHEYILSSSHVTDKYFNYYIKKPKKTFHYHFSSLNQSDIEKNAKYYTQKEQFKKELNLDCFVFLSVGQMIPRKGFDILLKAYAKSGLNDSTKLFMIGGKPYDELIQLKQELHLDNAIFMDAITKEELNKYYAASDAFVFTTREDIWGLVINEALSFGLPVISSDNCVVAEHFATDENAGMLIENENIDQFAEAMVKIYEDYALSNDESTKALSAIKKYTIENSANEIVSMFNCIMKKEA